MQLTIPHITRGIKPTTLLLLLPLILIFICHLDGYAQMRLDNLTVGTLFERGRAYAGRPEMADSALACYSEIISRYENDDSPEARKYLARAYNNSGYIWEYAKYDYRRAITQLLQSLDLCESLPEKIPTEAFVCLNLGNIFHNYAMHQEEPEKYFSRAREYWQRSLSVARDLRQWEIMLRAFIPLTVKAVEISDTREGRANMQSLCRLLTTSGVPEGIPLVGYCHIRAKAMQALIDGDREKASRLFKSELSCIDTDVTPERYRITTYNCLVENYALMNRPDSVARYLDLLEQTITRYDIKELRPLLTQSRLRHSTLPPDLHPTDSLRNSLKEETIDLLHEHKLDNISDIYLENRIEKSLQKEEEYIRDRSQGITIIVIISSAMVAVIGLAIFLILKLRNLKKRNRRLYELAHAAANRDTSSKDTISLSTPAQATDSTSTAPSPAPQPSTETDSGHDSSGSQKYAGSSLSQETLSEILRQALRQMDESDEIYTSDFSLGRLATLIDTRPRYLSQAISEIAHSNFNALLNERRIHEACRRFDDIAGYGNMTVEAVGQSVGFRSRSAFTEAFKKVAGMTPSAYARIARSRG